MDIQKVPTEKLKTAKYNPRKDLKPGDTEIAFTLPPASRMNLMLTKPMTRFH